MTGDARGAVGSSFSDYLADQGALAETGIQAVRRVLAHQLAAAMQDQKITRAEMAGRLQITRPQLGRLLDPSNDSVTLGTLSRAAQVIGRSLSIELR